MRMMMMRLGRHVMLGLFDYCDLDAHQGREKLPAAC